MAKRVAKGALLLRASAEGDGFSTLDALNGLNGVCVAMDGLIAGIPDVELYQQLAMAAKILSRIVADRVEV